MSISDSIVLRMGRGELIRAIPYKQARRSFIRSTIGLTDLRGLKLRRWLRRVALYSNIIG